MKNLFKSMRAMVDADLHHGEFDRDGFPKQSYLDGPTSAEAYAAEHLADHDQAAWKRHPNRDMRRANVMAKRATAAAIADQEIARREPLRQKRTEVALEVRKLAAEAEAKAAAAPDDEAVQADWQESRAVARAVLRNLDALQKEADATPLFALRSEKHDVERGSRRIRRQVSHDFRKARKPDPNKGRGSVPLEPFDLIELHGRFAANVLGIDGYNAALAEAQKIGKLKGFVPLVAKKAAEAVNEEREAA
jgi:hypothetical protein